MLDGDKKYGEKAGKGDGKCYWERGNHNYVGRLRVLLKENWDSNENECLQLLTTISMNPQNTMLSETSEAMRVHSVQFCLCRAQKTGTLIYNVQVKPAVIMEVKECLEGDPVGILVMFCFLIQVLLTLVCSVSENSLDWAFETVCIFNINVTC